MGDLDAETAEEDLLEASCACLVRADQNGTITVLNPKEETSASVLFYVIGALPAFNDQGSAIRNTSCSYDKRLTRMVTALFAASQPLG
jgi:hypothetical protein